jgi:hypothetical protein
MKFRQAGHGASQSGPNMMWWTISWRLPPNIPASAAGPCGPSKTYSFSIRTMGSLRRSVLSASRRRVSFFSSVSSRSLDSSHCSRDTTSGKAITTSLGNQNL